MCELPKMMSLGFGRTGSIYTSTAPIFKDVIDSNINKNIDDLIDKFCVEIYKQYNINPQEEFAFDNLKPKLKEIVVWFFNEEDIKFFSENDTINNNDITNKGIQIRVDYYRDEKNLKDIAKKLFYDGIKDITSKGKINSVG